ncbi:MAG: 3-oxoacyl-[acyl-carrier-protein] reductase [Rhizobiales bacterium PAR1]|nr:MAG: 3-oxoacyl-[acyl-carrier-protein] reductase [Rhizobiales bacterium PAR1]
MSAASHQGEVVLVTGAGRGIGQAIADAHAAAGAHVIYVDYDAALAENAAAAARDKDWYAIGLGADVSNEAAVNAAVTAAVEAFGPITALINNAGISPKSGADGRKSPLWEMPASEWQRVVDVNLTGAFLCSKAVAAGMIAAKKGSIVSISSVAGQTYCDFVGVHYAATKAALIGVTKHLAGELGPYGITVNAIAPGRITTPMMMGTASTTNELIRQATPMARFGTPDEVAQTALYLTSQASRFVTAQVIDVAGGWLMT